MAKPKECSLKKKEQSAVMRDFKTIKNARKIAENLKLPRYQVMYLLESKGLASYSESSYY